MNWFGKYKHVIVLGCFCTLSMGMFAQRTDPNSTPPGAPIFEHPIDDDAHRIAPMHPGNAGQRVAVSNIRIIESQSYNVGHAMDLNWSSIVTGMGHTPTIAPQSTLNSTAFFAGTDALIVSSGVIALSALQVTTIRQFLLTGKSVYIQGEYLPSYTTNIGFRDIVNLTGGTFSLGSTISGDLVPTNPLNLYATTPNAVAPLSYHWYGCTGSGCNNVEYFMRYGASNIGYVYCPTTASWGDMIQSTDQDWVNQSTSLPLMRNIVFALLSGNACSVVCGILDASRLDLQARLKDDGMVALDWSVDGDLPQGRFEVKANGHVIGMVGGRPMAGELFSFEDERLASGEQRYTVQFWDENGQSSVIGETTIDLGKQPARLRIATTGTGFEARLGEGYAFRALCLVDAAGRRTSLPVAGSGAVINIDMTSLPAGVYCLEGETTGREPLHARVVWVQ